MPTDADDDIHLGANQELLPRNQVRVLTGEGR